MMLRFIVLATLVALSYGLAISTNELKQHFEAFKVNHSVVYADEVEETRRFKVFAQNYRLIKEHNMAADNGEHSFWLGVNQFADLTFEEFSGRYLHQKVQVNASLPKMRKHKGISNDIPTSIDWREKGAVTSVKSQGLCRSSWAFTAAAAMEGANFVKTGKLVPLSAQNLIDCDTFVNEGCLAGAPSMSFNYVRLTGGIDTEESYPYKGKQEDCYFDFDTIGCKVTGYKMINDSDEEDLARVLAQQPVAVNIDASIFFMLYSHGIFDKSTFCSKKLDWQNLSLTAVGFGSDSKDFWILKNSFGTNWGEKGYVRFLRGENLCGIVTYASYPVL